MGLQRQEETNLYSFSIREGYGVEAMSRLKTKLMVRTKADEFQDFVIGFSVN